LKEGVVLFAHGSRDAQWSRPFEKIRDELSRRGVEVRLAFLELIKPSLPEALKDLEAKGMQRIRVVPVFLGYGGHLKKDLPALVAAANVQARVTIDPPVGEQQGVIDAIVALVGRGG
jgi:sirohydrochlorin cobaltochelatase